MDYSFADETALTSEQMDIADLKRTTQTLKVRLENFDLFRFLEDCGCGCGHSINDLVNVLGMIEPWQSGIIVSILKTLGSKLSVSQDELVGAYQNAQTMIGPDDDSMAEDNKSFAILCETANQMNKGRMMKAKSGM